MIPKIEDGNNFGVSIQEDTLAEVQSVESEAAAFFDQISRYFISRGTYVIILISFARTLFFIFFSNIYFLPHNYNKIISQYIDFSSTY